MTIDNLPACDAARVLRAMGAEPKCSDGLREVWYRAETPAIACRKHGEPGDIALINVFRGHRARLGESVTVTAIYSGGRSETFTIPNN